MVELIATAHPIEVVKCYRITIIHIQSTHNNALQLTSNTPFRFATLCIAGQLSFNNVRFHKSSRLSLFLVNCNTVINLTHILREQINHNE